MAIHLGQFVDCHSRLGSFAMTNRWVFISSPHRSAAPAPDGKETWLTRSKRGGFGTGVFCPRGKQYTDA